MSLLHLQDDETLPDLVGLANRLTILRLWRDGNDSAYIASEVDLPEADVERIRVAMHDEKMGCSSIMRRRLPALPLPVIPRADRLRAVVEAD